MMIFHAQYGKSLLARLPLAPWRPSLDTEVCVRATIPSNGTIRPTVIDKDLANRINRIRLRDQDYNIIEAVDFLIQLLYTLNF